MPGHQLSVRAVLKIRDGATGASTDVATTAAAWMSSRNGPITSVSVNTSQLEYGAVAESASLVQVDRATLNGPITSHHIGQRHDDMFAANSINGIDNSLPFTTPHHITPHHTTPPHQYCITSHAGQHLQKAPFSPMQAKSPEPVHKTGAPNSVREWRTFTFLEGRYRCRGHIPFERGTLFVYCVVKHFLMGCSNPCFPTINVFLWFFIFDPNTKRVLLGSGTL